MLLNKEMYQGLKDIQEFIATNGYTKLDGALLERFIKPRRTLMTSLNQAELTYEAEHELRITGTGFMAMAYYESEQKNKRRENIMIILAIGAWATAIIQPIIELLKWLF